MYQEAVELLNFSACCRAGAFMIHNPLLHFSLSQLPSLSSAVTFFYLQNTSITHVIYLFIIHIFLHKYCQIKYSNMQGGDAVSVRVMQFSVAIFA